MSGPDSSGPPSGPPRSSFLGWYFDFGGVACRFRSYRPILLGTREGDQAAGGVGSELYLRIGSARKRTLAAGAGLACESGDMLMLNAEPSLRLDAGGVRVCIVRRDSRAWRGGTASESLSLSIARASALCVRGV